MSYIKLTPIQADSLKGNYGIPRGTDNTYSRMGAEVGLLRHDKAIRQDYV